MNLEPNIHSEVSQKEKDGYYREGNHRRQGIHTEETRIERDTCTPKFIAALFAIARAWKQPRCP